MQSRLEEEEEAKAALMSRIQRLTKLILVSSKTSIPGYLGETLSHQRSLSASEDDVSSVELFLLCMLQYFYLYFASNQCSCIIVDFFISLRVFYLLEIC